MNEPTAPSHAAPEEEAARKRRAQHKFALYHPGSNTTLLPFVITRHKAGEIVTAVARPKLQMTQGHIAALPLGQYDKQFRQKMPVWIATADGLRYANTFAGWQVTFPQVVNVPGLGPQANPYIETDRSGAFVKGFARAIGIGRSALTGDLMIVDRPVHVSVQSYIEEDLAGKSAYNPTAIVWGSKDMNPMDAVADAVTARNEELEQQIAEYAAKQWNTAKLTKQVIHEEAITAAETQYRRGLWKFFPLIGDDIGIWVNMASKVVTRIFQTMVQKRKFGSRLLPSIAERNVLRTALGFYRAAEGLVEELWPDPEPDGRYRDVPKVMEATWRPEITVHRMEFEPHEILEFRRNYLAGVRGGLLAKAEVDFELEDASSENLMLVSPEDASLDQKGRGSDIVETISVTGEAMSDLDQEVDERKRLIVEAKKYLDMVSMETADSIREVCFDDPVLVNMESEDLEKLKVFVVRLRAAAAEESERPVDEGEMTIPETKPEEPPRSE